MTTGERYYYRNRAEEELAAAFDAANIASAESHRGLAKLYFAKASEPEGDDVELWSKP